MVESRAILVAGATGQQGGAVARNLLKRGLAVRALTRDPGKVSELRKLGMEVALGNLTDRPSLDEALHGIKRVFLVTTPFEKGMETEVQQGMTAVNAARAAGVEHLVYTSVASVDRATGIPHFETKWKVEQHIRKSGVPATILRPVFFMENFGSSWLLPGIKNGKLTLPVRPDHPLQMIALDDIGEVAATAFENPRDYIGQVVELAGDEKTLPDAMRLLSKAIGKPILYEQMPDERSEKAFGKELAIMFRWFNDVGYDVDIAALRKRYGIALTQFEELIAHASWVESLK